MLDIAKQKFYHSSWIQDYPYVPHVIECFQAFHTSRIMSANDNPVEYLGPFFSLLESYFVDGISMLSGNHARWLSNSKDNDALDIRQSLDHHLYETWQYERCLIEDFELIIRRIELSATILRARNGTIENEKINKACRRYDKMVRQARTHETHMRDEIQLNVGNLSLQESRRSIAQSDSVGRISFLAFVFFPISIVCSFFGMNIQEMTGSGASWKVFFISAASLSGLIMAISALLWRKSRRLRFILYIPLVPFVLVCRATIIIFSLDSLRGWLKDWKRDWWNLRKGFTDRGGLARVQ